MGSCLKILRGVPWNSNYTDTVIPHKNYAASGTVKPDMNSRDAVLSYLKSKAVFSTKTIEEEFENKAPIAYVRESENTVKVNVKRDDLEGCNYLMFTNDLLTDTYDGLDDDYFWHFAFIDSLEYISEGATRIRFSIDVMQTWLPTIKVASATVEREHIYKDLAGDNIEPEPIAPIEYVRKHQSLSDYPNYRASNFDVVIIYTPKTYFGAYNSYVGDRFLGTDATGNKTYTWGNYGASNIDKSAFTVQNGVATGKAIAIKIRSSCLNTDSKSENDIAWLNALIENIISELGGNITGMYALPTGFITEDMIDTALYSYVLEDKGAKTYANLKWGYLKNGFVTHERTVRTSDVSDIIGNAKNKKIGTYPFTKITLVTSQNKKLELRPEFFDRLNANSEYFEAKFFSTFSPLPDINLTICPTNYKIGTDCNFSISYNSFPSIPWSESVSDQFVRDKTISSISTVLSSALSLWAGSYVPGIGYQMSGYQNLIGLATDYAKAQIAPREACGSSGLFGDLMAGISGIAILIETPTEIDAARIDDFFTKYGYATNKVKTPNVFDKTYYPSDRESYREYHTRKNFNYLKCVLPQITHKSGLIDDLDLDNQFSADTSYTTSIYFLYKFIRYLPSSSEVAKITDILSRGITFWENPNEIGNYEIDNSPRNAKEGD